MELLGRIHIELQTLHVVKSYFIVALMTSECRPRELMTRANRDGCARKIVVEHNALLRGVRQQANIDVRDAVVTSRIGALELDTAVLAFTCALIPFSIPVRIETSLDLPVIVDRSRRFKTELEVVRGRLSLVAFLLVLVLVLELARPLDVVDAALEVRDADAEVVELFAELSSETVDHGLLLCIDLIFLRHGLRDHLRHLVARDLVLAAVRAVAIAFDDAIVSKLGYCIVCPMIGRNIAERVRRSERRRGCTDDKSRRERCCESLLHEKLLL